MTELDIRRCDDVTDASLALLARGMKNDKCFFFEFSECFFCDGAACPNLSKLFITAPQNVTDAGLGYICHLSQLTTLYSEGSAHIRGMVNFFHVLCSCVRMGCC